MRNYAIYLDLFKVICLLSILGNHHETTIWKNILYFISSKSKYMLGCSEIFGFLAMCPSDIFFELVFVYVDYE